MGPGEQAGSSFDGPGSSISRSGSERTTIRKTPALNSEPARSALCAAALGKRVTEGSPTGDNGLCEVNKKQRPLSKHSVCKHLVGSRPGLPEIAASSGGDFVDQPLPVDEIVAAKSLQVPKSPTRRITCSGVRRWLSFELRWQIHRHRPDAGLRGCARFARPRSLSYR